MTLCRFILPVISLLFIITPLLAQNDDGLVEIESMLKTQQAALEELDAQIKEADTDDEALFAIRQTILDMRLTARRAREEIAQRRLTLVETLKDIGPAPGESELSEPENISKQRDSLSQRLSKLDGLLKESEIHINQATRFLQRIASARRSLFFKSLFVRETPPVNFEFWQTSILSFFNSKSDVLEYLKAWQNTRAEDNKLVVSLAIMTFVLIASSIMAIWFHRWSLAMIARQVMMRREPTPVARKFVLCLRLLASVIPVLISGAMVYGVLRIVGILTAEAISVALTIWGGIVLVTYVVTWGRQIFASCETPWLPANILFRKANSLLVIVTSMAIVFVIDSTLLQASRVLNVAIEITFAQSVVSTTLLSALLMVFAWLAVPIIKENASEDSRSRVHVVAMVRWCALGLATLAMFASLSGYISFGRYLVERTILVVIILSSIWVFRTLLRNGAHYLDAVLSKGRKSDKTITEEDQQSFFRYWSGLILDLILFLVSVPVILLMVGVEWSQFDDWLIRIFHGFQIGSTTISIVNLLQAVTFFLLLLFLTRLVQGMIEKKFIPKTHMDKGASNSLVTLVGYVGFLIAAIVAVSALGLDFSNIALIAGALSVGIGFGLQSIVNNFVSGLILLFERPVKVGDWVVLASGEGFVKSISVRSTVIQTFDHASIIVPNSELISSSVTNWTLTDRQGRVIILVGVSYKSDPEEVRNVLLGCAESHPRLAKYPAPVVYFKEFGNSSLDFELRVFLKEINEWIKVKSELRFMIFKAFKEAGIEIPFPQRDVHIKEPTRDLSS